MLLLWLGLEGQVIDELVEHFLGRTEDFGQVGGLAVLSLQHVVQVLPGDLFDLLGRFLSQQLLETRREVGHQSYSVPFELLLEGQVS